MIKTSLIILTRNEINGLQSLIKKIPFSSVDEYFAVDYNSTDGTVEFFDKNKIPVIRQEKPGRAEAFRIGAKKAKGEMLVFFSPDGNEDPSDIPRLIEKIEQGCDLVIASRFMQGARNEEDDRILKLRAWANRGFTLFANLLWNRNLGKYQKSNIKNQKYIAKNSNLTIKQFNNYISDSINGYRAITKSAFNRLHLDATGFAIEYQMTIRTLKLGLKIAEIPTREGYRIGGKSGSSAIPTGLKFIYYLLREIAIGKNF